MKRSFELDFFRGLAMVMMAIFHFMFDLKNFRFIDVTFTHGPLKMWQLSILSLFVLVSGVSLYLAYHQSINWKKFRKRMLLLGGSALLITITTMFVFPKSWIYFGVLHFMFFASIIGLLFVRIPTISLVLGIAIVVAYQIEIFKFLSLHELYVIVKEPLSLPGRSEDLVRFFPWFGVFLIGIYLGKMELFSVKIGENRVTLAIAKLGNYALAFYLIHQPILFGSVMAVYMMTKG
jgi:uncharacterized membrane protein